MEDLTRLQVLQDGFLLAGPGQDHQLLIQPTDLEGHGEGEIVLRWPRCSIDCGMLGMKPDFLAEDVENIIQCWSERILEKEVSACCSPL